MKPYALLIILLALITGCGSETPVVPAKPAPKAIAKPPVAQVPPPGKEEITSPTEVKFIYQAEGRRDPFLPLLATVKSKSSVGREFENPLEAYDLIQYQLKGVIVGFGEPKAIVSAPDGKSYILRKGLRIGKSSGVILEITHEKVLVEEQYQDLSGATHTNIQEIKVPKREGV